jgi:hypothetical protein
MFCFLQQGSVHRASTYYGVTQLHRTEREVRLMPIGHLLDQWEIHKQFTGISKPYEMKTIDDVFPVGMV